MITFTPKGIKSENNIIVRSAGKEKGAVLINALLKQY
jgi:hypothetical protein